MIERPCRNGETTRKNRSPNTLDAAPCKASKAAAAKAPLNEMASRWAQKCLVRLGRSADAGKNTVPNALVPSRKIPKNTATAVSLARKSLRRSIDKVQSTKASSRSGKKRSHSKRVTTPIATNEYIT